MAHAPIEDPTINSPFGEPVWGVNLYPAEHGGPDRIVTTQVFHREAVAGGWVRLSLMEKLGNIGTEVGRAARAREVGNDLRAWNAMSRALELFDLTIADSRWHGPKRREICRAREIVCDFIAGDNEYRSSAESLDRYFLPFALAARRDVTGSASRLGNPVAPRVGPE